jgi:hypothetical protein
MQQELQWGVHALMCFLPLCSAPASDTAGADMMLQHCLASYGGRGRDLALKWLYRLFVMHAHIAVSASHTAAASAHIHAPQVHLSPCRWEHQEIRLKPARQQATWRHMHLHLVLQAMSVCSTPYLASWCAVMSALFMQVRAALASALDDDDGMADEDTKVGEGPEEAAKSEEALGSKAEDADGAAEEGADEGAVAERHSAGTVGLSDAAGGLANSLAGTPYEVVLLALLEGLR